LKYEVNSLEEGLAIATINKHAEIEFLKVNAIVNAIIGTGNAIRSTIGTLAGGTGETPSMDALNKTMETLKEALLPHWTEDTEKRSKEAMRKLKQEMDGGPLKVQVMAKPKKGGRK
jgi:hypothetical protein